jgi:hypothetical protein
MPVERKVNVVVSHAVVTAGGVEILDERNIPVFALKMVMNGSDDLFAYLFHADLLLYLRRPLCRTVELNSLVCEIRSNGLLEQNRLLAASSKINWPGV